MPAMRPPFITIAAPMSSCARTLIASSTVWSGRMDTMRVGFALSNSATVFMRTSSHVGVVRAAAAFRHDPYDVLRRVLDVAGLAVHAVLRVDPQALRAAFLHEFVDPVRTVARLGACVNREVQLRRNRR